MRTASRVYAAIGHRVRARSCDPLAGRAWVGQATKMHLALRAWSETLMARLRAGQGGPVEGLAPPRRIVHAEEVLPVGDLRPLRGAGVEPHV